MNFKKRSFFMLFTLLILEGCGVEYRDNPNCNYLSLEEFRVKSVEILAAREINNAGKIYKYKNLILVQEKDKGIHLIDNSDKNNPIAKNFIKIMGNLDMAVKEGYLYVDSYMDLVIVDMRDLENLKVINRKEDTFSYDPFQSSDFTKSYYCGEYDKSKGIFVGEME